MSKTDVRIPPYNSEAEIAVLGSVLRNNECWHEVFTIVEEIDFYSEAHRRIFKKMHDMFGTGLPVDPVTLGHELKKDGDLEKVGGAIIFSKLLDSVATTANVSYYAAIVKETAAVRKIIYKSQEITSICHGDYNIEKVSSEIDEIVEASLQLHRSRMPETLFSLGDKVLENYRLVASGFRGIPFPWKTMDNMTAGMWPGTVTMFVARPNVGKTQISVICAKHAWKCGHKTLIVSPEMNKVEIAERFFVMEAKVPYQNVISGELSTGQELAFESSIESLRMLDNLWIMDYNDDLSPSGIDAAIRACGAKIVSLDSMYDIHLKGERRDRMLASLEWFKNSAKSKQNQYAALGFGQQNRTAEISEKKGGGSRLGTIALLDEVGQDAQNIFALEQSPDDKADKVLRIKTLKIRRGMKKDIKLRWDFDTMNFDELEDDGDEEDDGRIPF